MNATVSKLGFGDDGPERAVDDASQDTATALAIGTLVGSKYAIKRVLGSGGDGAVYEGEHTEIGHLVAIKIAHRSRADREDIMERFRREARICGSLRHAHVGQIYDVGQLEDGSPYMVMELQQGRSLADVLDETLLPVAAVIDVTRQLLAGLIAAHRAGVIHRDVKPDNVMLVRDNSGDVVVKLVDFGISKSIEPARDTSVTGDGIIVGSPDYMPPEQLRGDAVDVRTDVYAVGVLLYESVTRQLPFDAPTLPDLVAAILRDPFKKPTELRRDCPPELERVILKAMSREPDDRYQTAEELSRALAQLQLVVARPVTAPHLALLSASLAQPSAAALRTRHTRTIDTRMLQRMAVRDDVSPRTKNSVRMRIAAGALAVIGVFMLLRGMLQDAPAPIVSTSLPVAAAKESGVPAHAPVSAASASSERPSVPATSAGRAPEVATDKPKPLAAKSRVAAAATADPQSDAALLKEAGTAFVLGQVQRAYTLYKQIVVRKPQHADAWRGLGMSAARVGARDEAARAFERYLALRPNATDSERVRQQLAKVQ